MMKRYPFWQLDVFTERPFGGNQLAVFPDGRGLSSEEMQVLTREMNFSECTFIFPPQLPGTACKVRIFTPGMEMPMAGHPTVGSAAILAARGKIAVPPEGGEVVLELGIGPVPVIYEPAVDGKLPFVWMKHRAPEYGDVRADRDLGHWEVEDMNAAYHWLVKEGIARPDEVLLTGESYGGYLTLLGLGKSPELWAGGMSGIAIADWAVLWEDTADTLRGYQEALFGGTPSDVPDRYRDSSPITYAANVRAPVLIIQGRNDTRTPARPVEMYEQKLKELGKEVHVHWFETGHMGSFADTELGIGHQEMKLQFAQRILG